jgi:hypothetical protein
MVAIDAAAVAQGGGGRAVAAAVFRLRVCGSLREEAHSDTMLFFVERCVPSRAIGYVLYSQEKAPT